MRQALTDGSGRHFDRARAQSFAEDTEWDGRNHISCATGSQWNHEELYRTAGGRWILHYSSQWQGARPSWTELSAQEAAGWLVRNGHDAHPACAQEYQALEIN